MNLTVLREYYSVNPEGKGRQGGHPTGLWFPVLERRPFCFPSFSRAMPFLALSYALGPGCACGLAAAWQDRSPGSQKEKQSWAFLSPPMTSWLRWEPWLCFYGSPTAKGYQLMTRFRESARLTGKEHRGGGQRATDPIAPQTERKPGHKEGAERDARSRCTVGRGRRTLGGARGPGPGSGSRGAMRARRRAHGAGGARTGAAVPGPEAPPPRVQGKTCL